MEAVARTDPEPELLRARDAAALLGVHEDDVYRLAHAGAIPSLRLGRRLRIPRRLLLAWIEQQAGGGR